MYKLDTSHWHILRVTHLLGGLFSFTGVLLGIAVAPAWFALTIFVGCMQMFFAFSGYCPTAMLFARMGIPQTEKVTPQLL